MKARQFIRKFVAKMDIAVRMHLLNKNETDYN
jgi:hypothetical protein